MIVITKENINPIKITLLTLGAWIILTIIVVSFIEDVSEEPFVVAVCSFYLLPFACIVAFIVSSFFYRSWVNKHKIIVAITLGLLILWALRIVLYIRSLFI